MHKKLMAFVESTRDRCPLTLEPLPDDASKLNCGHAFTPKGLLDAMGFYLKGIQEKTGTRTSPLCCPTCRQNTELNKAATKCYLLIGTPVYRNIKDLITQKNFDALFHHGDIKPLSTEPDVIGPILFTRYTVDHCNSDDLKSRLRQTIASELHDTPFHVDVNDDSELGKQKKEIQTKLYDIVLKEAPSNSTNLWNALKSGLDSATLVSFSDYIRSHLAPIEAAHP